MKIEKDCVVTMDYKLTDDKSKLLDESGDQPLAYLHGHGQIISGLEAALQGKGAGESIAVTVSPDDAYGEYDDRLVIEVPLSQLSGIKNLSVGMQIEGESPEGMDIFTVVEMGSEQVKLDGNHPLAGETLTFDVKIKSIRQATQEEIDHGHAHGEGGHQH